MGRRAKKAPVVTKKRPKLSKRFKCPFCANEDTVECKMDFKAGIGTLTCRLCTANYQMPIHHLHEPIDVFSEWLDDCEAAQNPGSNAAATTTYDDGDDDDDDDDLPESSGLGQRKPSAKPSSSTTNNASRNNNNARSIDLGDEDSDDDDDDDE